MSTNWSARARRDAVDVRTRRNAQRRASRRLRLGEAVPLALGRSLNPWAAATTSYGPTSQRLSLGVC